MLNKKLIGFDADQVPTNGMLGTMAFQAFNNVNITGGRIAESVLPTIVSSGKVSDTALSSNVFLKSTAQTLTNRVTFAASTASVPSLNIPHGTAPSAPTNGDVWTTTTGLFVRINGATEQLAELAANTFTGKQTFPAATTSIASINMPHGTAPSAPANGDVWTTTGGVFCRVNGQTQKIDNQIATVKLVTSGGATSGTAVAIEASDEIVVVNKSASEVTNLTLPASPLTGKVIIVKDGKGNAASFSITIRPAAGTIDGITSYGISTNYGFFGFVYNGTQWNRIA